MENYVPPENDSDSDEAPAKKGKKSAAGKGKGKKKAKTGPKRTLSAYMFFVRENRAKIQAAHPDAKFKEIGQLVGSKWKSLSDEEKVCNILIRDDKFYI